MLTDVSDVLASVERVTKRYGGRAVLDDCSLQIAPGEVLGVAGPNGAGKTTLARLLLGFSLPSSGSVHIGGIGAADFRVAHGVGYAAEESDRPWPYTVRELLGLREGARGPLTTDELIASLSIEHLLDQRIDRISKGQWRLVVVAYAMIGAPRLVVLDEPDSGLDPDALDHLLHTVKLAAARGSALVIFSHNLDELERLCDRIVILLSGQMRASFAHDEFTSGGMRNLYRNVARA